MPYGLEDVWAVVSEKHASREREKKNLAYKANYAYNKNLQDASEKRWKAWKMKSKQKEQEKELKEQDGRSVPLQKKMIRKAAHSNPARGQYHAKMKGQKNDTKTAKP